MRVTFRVGQRVNEYHVCIWAIGDIHFSAVKNIVFAIAHCSSGHATHNVGTGAGLSHCKRPEVLPTADSRQVLFVQELTTVSHEVIGKKIIACHVVQ